MRRIIIHPFRNEDRLSSETRAALHAIVSANRPWITAEEMADMIDASIWEDLENEGYLVRWIVEKELNWPDGIEPRWMMKAGTYHVLTPWGAEVLGVVMVEHWEFSTTNELHFTGPRRPPRKVHVRRAMEMPAWVDIEHERRDTRSRRFLCLPKHARMTTLDNPEQIADPLPSPGKDDLDDSDVLIDPRTGRPFLLWGLEILRSNRRMHRGSR